MNASANGGAVLEVSALCSHYGRIQALHGVSVKVAKGALVALVGANGAGKTTLLRTISGVQPASEGKILFCGEDITRLRSDKRVRLGIAQVPEGRQVFGPMPVEEQMLAIGRALMGEPKLLLLDEPSMGLAPQLVAEIFRAIVALAREGMTMLLVEQNAQAALSIADVGYVLETGQTVMSGPGKALLQDERIRQAYLGM